MMIWKRQLLSNLMLREEDGVVMNWNERISPTIKAVPPSGIRKFFDLANSMEGVLSLSVGEPDFAPPKKVLDACIEGYKREDTSYTSNAGTLELRQEIAKLFSTRYGVDYDPKSEIMVTIGVSEGIDVVLRAFLNAGDEVLIPDPAYVAYPAAVQINGGVPVLVPTYAKDDFKLTVEAMESLVTPKTKAILLGYPNNPTGATMDREALSKVADFAIKHDLIVISDEIYCELTYEGEHTCVASLPNMKERTVVLNGFSKAYAMTGLRIGYVCAPAELLAAALKIHQYGILAAPTNSQLGALTALRECDDDVHAMFEEYKARREMIAEGFRKMGLPFSMPNGAFYIFPDISSTGLSSEEFAETLLLTEKVAVVPGTAFGPAGSGFVRISYASSRETIKEALVRIERFINSLK